MPEGVSPNSRGRLKELSSEELVRLAELLVSEKYVQSAMDIFYSEFPGAHEYPYSTILAYTKSAQFLDVDSGIALSNIREELETKPLVPVGDRIFQLAGLFWNLKDSLLGEKLPAGGRVPLTVQDKINVIKELRQILKDLKEEAQPFDTKIGIVLSPLEAFLDGIKLSESKSDGSSTESEDSR